MIFFVPRPPLGKRIAGLTSSKKKGLTSGRLVVKFAPMRAALLTHLDSHWATRLGCDSAALRNQNTNILADSRRANAEVWLFDKTCVMVAAPHLAQALKASVGTRAPVVAFEPGRLKEAVSFLGLDLHGPEAIMVLDCPEVDSKPVAWIPVGESVAELQAGLRVVAGSAIPLVAIPLKMRPVRRAAEACGFTLYASVIYIGDKPEL